MHVSPFFNLVGTSRGRDRGSSIALDGLFARLALRRSLSIPSFIKR